jgi:hypothetical protein
MSRRRPGNVILLRVLFLWCSTVALLCPLEGSAQQSAVQPSPHVSSAGGDQGRARSDGQHDFDFHIGTWKTHVSRLLHPLTGSSAWAQYDGITIVHKIWDGRANLVELEADGTNGHLALASWRLYNPDSHQWSLNVASVRTGVVGVPTIGEFRNGRGEFYDQETLNGRAILVRFVISEITPDSCHFEQAFSDDGGTTWEVNWIATDTRVKDDKTH